jgi:glycosyltransferase involved in cell wall biosynthesis
MISIVIPVYNSENTILTTLDSVIHQSSTKWKFYYGGYSNCASQKS